ncbi:chromosome segregation ATPase [Bradyrhizobium sp. USDA 4341]
MRIALFVLMMVIGALSSGTAFAQSETDRLRDALRSATAQTRALEDQRTALQAKVADADREKAAAKKEVDDLKAQLKKADKEHRDAVDEFNQRLVERDETLEKWKSAYEEAATVARTKDAERAKFEGEATAYKASTKSCIAKNTQLIKAGKEMVQRYKDLTIGEIVVSREPMIQQRRVEIQNQLQESQDKFLDQKVNP